MSKRSLTVILCERKGKIVHSKTNSVNSKRRLKKNKDIETILNISNNMIVSRIDSLKPGPKSRNNDCKLKANKTNVSMNMSTYDKQMLPNCSQIKKCKNIIQLKKRK